MSLRVRRCVSVLRRHPTVLILDALPTRRDWRYIYGDGVYSYQFIFTNLVEGSPRLFTTIQAVFK